MKLETIASIRKTELQPATYEWICEYIARNEKVQIRELSLAVLIATKYYLARPAVFSSQAIWAGTKYGCQAAKAEIVVELFDNGKRASIRSLEADAN
jgi:hypothetical protein